VILSNSADELDELLAAVADPASDALAEERRILKEYLLGPDEPTSMEQFDTAVQNLVAKSLARNAGVEQRLAEPEPEPEAEPEPAPGFDDTPVGG
jgi:hypothetical protein